MIPALYKPTSTVFVLLRFVQVEMSQIFEELNPSLFHASFSAKNSGTCASLPIAKQQSRTC